MPKVIVEKVIDNLYVLRLDDDKVKYFESLWYIPEGITYNAYLLLTENSVVLFDTWKHTYINEFIEALNKLVDIKDITHIVVHHMEPDHSGCLPKILELNNYRAKVLGHILTGRMIKSFYGIEPKFKEVKDGEETVIDGLRLRFIHTPWLHWPETIMTYIEDYEVLLSGDAFGGFSIPKTVFDEDDEVVSNYLPYVRKYVATIIGHYKERVVKNISKIVELGISAKVVAPLHGLIWCKLPKTIIDYYLKLAKATPDKKILVIYSSMYGFVEKAVIEAIKEVKKQGFNVKVFKFTDTYYDNVGDLIGEAIDSAGIMIGTATYESSIFPYMNYVAQLLVQKIGAQKPVLIISCYGWGGVAGKQLLRILSKNFKVIDIIEFNGTPSTDVLEKIRKGVEKLTTLK